MRKLTIQFAVTMFFAQIAFFGIAELNYSNALRDARMSEGSDADIRIAMANHGFHDIWVMNPVEPDLLEKTQALISISF